ncbi:MAG: hypothetical protein LBW77_03630, partial [Verrucomicrobiota bacterium]|jgi:hypothetical protein|nr:hypothetical protein [Verrucomicrobiota bacterium]
MQRDYISGIFNYCDYWCDRCAFTRHCRNYAMGEELQKRGNAGRRTDEGNRAAWDSLDGVLARARGQLDELAARRFDDVFDLEEPTAEELRAFGEAEEALDRKVQRHFVMKAAEAYRVAVSEWLEAVKPDVAEAAALLVEQARFANGADGRETREQLDGLEELIDIVSWYHTLLMPKAGRMIHGLLELAEQADWDDGSDVYGTGKLLLVSIDRSIAAWVALRDALPKQEDPILGFLIRLDHLRRAIERDVPQARAYRRPGLDD